MCIPALVSEGTRTKYAEFGGLFLTRVRWLHSSQYQTSPIVGRGTNNIKFIRFKLTAPERTFLLMCMAKGQP